MPIRKEHRYFYPIDWPQLSAWVRFARAKGCCEVCGRPHGKIVHHLGDGRWFDEQHETWRDGRGRDLDEPVGRLRIGHVRLDGEGPPAERLDLAGGLGGRRLVAAVAERDVRALRRQPQRRSALPIPREPPVTRAVLPDRSITRGPPSGRAPARPGRRRRAGRRSSRAGASARRAPRGSGRPSPSRPAAGRVTSSGRIAASPIRPRAGSAVHSIVTAPLVKPAPNATIVTLSPTLTRPSFTASARAIGTDAAEVLPYLSRLMNILSIGRSRPFATASMIRTFAWCGMNRSTSAGCEAGPPDRFERGRRHRLRREPVGLVALHPDVVLAAGDRLGRRRRLRAAGRQPDHVGALRLGRHLDAERAARLLATRDSTTAPAPSPKRMQVLRSV